jgi:hypothetical protein
LSISIIGDADGPHLGPRALDGVGQRRHDRAVVQRAGQRVALGRLEQRRRLPGEPPLSRSEDEEEQRAGDERRAQRQDHDLAAHVLEALQDRHRRRARCRRRPRTWPSTEIGRSSRTTVGVPIADGVAPAGGRVEDRGLGGTLRGGTEVGVHGRRSPIDSRIVGGDEGPIGRRISMRTISPGRTSEASWPSSRVRSAPVGGVPASRSGRPEVGVHEGPRRRRVTADHVVQRGRLEVGADQQRLGGRGHPDDGQEHAQHQQQQERAGWTDARTEHDR